MILNTHLATADKHLYNALAISPYSRNVLWVEDIA